jgi:hypothetical protein
MDNPHLDRLLDSLWPSSGDHRPAGEVYALLDGACDPRIYPILRYSLVDSCCLYGGELPRELAEVAPYLVALARPSRLTAGLLAAGWGESWGILLASTAILQDLRRHFRRFLRVQDERGRRLLFRFYDPRVLRTYLPTCDAAELRRFFGPVDRYVVEGPAPGALIEFRHAGAGLVQDVVDLGAAPRPAPPERRGSSPSHRPEGDPGGGGGIPVTIIRQEQMEAFEREAGRQFVDRLMAHIRPAPHRCPPGLDEATLRRMVVRGIERARGHGLTGQRAITLFVGLMFEVAPNFDEYPPIRALLARADRTPDARMDLLLDTLSPGQWHGALRRHDPAAWGP